MWSKTDGQTRAGVLLPAISPSKESLIISYIAVMLNLGFLLLSSPCRTCQYGGWYIPLYYFGMVLVNLYSIVWDWLISRVGLICFYLSNYSSFCLFAVFLSLGLIPRTGVLGLIECLHSISFMCLIFFHISPPSCGGVHNVPNVTVQRLESVWRHTGVVMFRFCGLYDLLYCIYRSYILLYL